MNSASGQNFSAYINNYRIEDINALMANQENHRRTLIELAYESGFNSKSAFNRIYRQMTGVTPGHAFREAKTD